MTEPIPHPGIETVNRFAFVPTCGPTFDSCTNPSRFVSPGAVVDPNALPAYQDMGMLKATIFAISAFASVAALPGAAVTQAQGPVPPAQTALTAPQNTESSAQTGREPLNTILDGLAAKYTAKRTADVAEIRTRAQAEARQAAVRKKLLALIGELLNARRSTRKIWARHRATVFASERCSSKASLIFRSPRCSIYPIFHRLVEGTPQFS